MQALKQNYEFTSILDNPRSEFSKQIRQLRTNLLNVRRQTHWQSLQVTSAGKGECKSMVATNLSIALALSDLKVLLVDVNFDNPHLQEVFDARSTSTIPYILHRKVQLCPLVTDVKNLHILNADEQQPIAEDQFERPQFVKLLADLKQKYDVIILDGPALTATADAQIIASKVDTNILTIKLKQTKRNELQAAQEQLKVVHADVMGTVAIED